MRALTMLLPSQHYDDFKSFRQHTRLTCTNCDFATLYENPLPRCPVCGEDILETHYDLEGLKQAGWLDTIARRKPGIWRYRELLPLNHSENIVSLGEGGTPLIHMHNLGAMLGLKYLFFKDERQGPTNSFKDRQ